MDRRQITARNDSQTGEVDRLVAQLIDELRSGLAHGYFAFSVKGKVIGGDRREVLLETGKAHRFEIPKEQCT